MMRAGTLPRRAENINEALINIVMKTSVHEAMPRIRGHALHTSNTSVQPKMKVRPKMSILNHPPLLTY